MMPLFILSSILRFFVVIDVLFLWCIYYLLSSERHVCVCMNVCVCMCECVCVCACVCVCVSMRSMFYSCSCALR